MSRHVKHEAEDDNPPTKKAKSSSVAEDDNPLTKVAKSSLEADEVRFSGKPVPVDEARQKWPDRYQSKDKVKLAASSSRSMGVESETKEVLQARCHYNQALVDGFVFDLYDDAYVKGEEGGPDYIAKIVELFETIDRNLYFTAQWFYRADDTLDLVEKEKKLSSADLYYDDMMYSLAHFSFTTPHTGTVPPRAESDASSISDASSNTTLGDIDASKSQESRFCESMTLLDLYSGCGAMSTGLCLGASISGLKLVNRWAVDINSDASQSLKLNHPQTEVRNEGAEDFLSLLKEWEKLCKEYELVGSCRTEDSSFEENIIQNEEEEDDDGFSVQPGEFEVGKLLAVCYGDPNEVHKRGLYFKVRWRGYGPSDDTWEPVDGLSNCKESIKEFVTRGFKSKILPLPGDVDFICGGPPCQGMSGYNRFRNISQPLNDPKNHQLVVFMDIVEFLKPQYILMENVVDIVKMARGVLGSYAISRLVSMDYQARMGILAAGSFGVPQCRMRFFLWGAHCTKASAMQFKLPQYPLPTHTFVGKGIVTNEFKEILVGYENGKSCNLEKSVVLKDALYDLPEPGPTGSYQLLSLSLSTWRPPLFFANLKYSDGLYGGGYLRVHGPSLRGHIVGANLPDHLLQVPQILHRQGLQEARDHEDRLFHQQAQVQGQEDGPRRDQPQGVQPRPLPLQVQVRRRRRHRPLRRLRPPQLPLRGKSRREASVCSGQNRTEDEPPRPARRRSHRLFDGVFCTSCARLVFAPICRSSWGSRPREAPLGPASSQCPIRKLIDRFGTDRSISGTVAFSCVNFFSLEIIRK
ncbi:transmembrane/coiled-coil protein [Actinidia rufa]|uniref:DNA (cytosine-5-)-methyltransferase n=1 Tax=Actinidia rufa TaxID=165716 RepID=A0A7J0E500_9ERIC|nr:transmembrane/coiled-coil protein [Actinidia rufa]